MSHLPDTSFLYSLYRRQVNSPRAIAFMQALEGPLRVSSLTLLEFRQSIRFQIRLRSIDHGKGFSKVEATGMLRDLQSDLAGGVLLVGPADWVDVHRLAEELSAKYTEASGHRLIDILHVATAVYLGAEEFLTFDSNQKLLAENEGLKVPL